MKRILVIRGGAIGDFILTLPAIGLLRNRHPASHLEILGYKHITALAEKRFYADATRSIEYSELARFFAKGADLPEHLATYFGSFDLIVSYLFDPDLIFENNLRRCGKFTFIVGPARPSSPGIHAALQLARPMETLGLTLSDPAAHLHPSPADRELADAFFRDEPHRSVAIHPGSGGATKNWAATNWSSLGERILASDKAIRLLILTGEAECDTRIGLGKTFGARARHVANLPLPQLAAVVERCAIFLGHDSGISHLAAAVGRPCLLLFGPTDPEIWAPKNPGVRTLRAADGRLDSLAPGDVFYELMRIGIST